MLDVAFLEQLFLDLALARRIENLLLDRGMDRKLEANLRRKALLAPVAARILERLEQFLDRAVVVFQKRDRVARLGLGHWYAPSVLRRKPTACRRCSYGNGSTAHHEPGCF